MRAISGTARDSSSRSLQSMIQPAARATATQCIAWFVEPPLASRPTSALTMQRASTMRPIASAGLPAAATIARMLSASSAARSGSRGCTNAPPGNCSPIRSSISWLLLAVP